MRFADVAGMLNDLPVTFTRQEAPYTQLVDALTLSIATATASEDGLAVQGMTIQQAMDGWLDVWGLLFGVPRNSGEGNLPYVFRIGVTVAAVVGTLPAIQLWMNIFMPGGSVTDNAMAGSPPVATGQIGYTLTFPAYATLAQIGFFVASLGRIRPAGMPFTLQQGGSGLFMGTVNYFGEGQEPGSYLTATATLLALGIGPWTNSSAMLLPDSMFTDPALNGLVA